MISEFRLKEALVSYKQEYLHKHWPDEKYKWQAVKCFQVNWDANVDNHAR